MPRRAIIAPDAPKPIGAYSHAVAAGGLMFLAGQIPLDPATGVLIEGDIAAQTRRVMENIRLVLAAEGLDLGDVVKTTVFLADIADGKTVNAVYGEYFAAGPPARSTVGAALPAGARIEIEAVAALRG